MFFDQRTALHAFVVNFISKLPLWCGLPFGVTAQWGAVHSVFRQMLTLQVGMETMMRCHRVGPVMMRYSLVGSPLEVSSLANEVDGQDARFHMSTT